MQKVDEPTQRGNRTEKCVKKAEITEQVAQISRTALQT